MAWFLFGAGAALYGLWLLVAGGTKDWWADRQRRTEQRLYRESLEDSEDGLIHDEGW